MIKMQTMHQIVHMIALAQNCAHTMASWGEGMQEGGADVEVCWRVV
jgi:hypothetical protein